MFDNKVIIENSLQNVNTADGQHGFSLKARLPYYRGLGLSMVEDIAITVDGEKIPRENVRFTARGNTWTLDEMETEYGDRWNFAEQATITAFKAGGLAAGQHEVQLAIRFRVSYLPFVPTTSDTKSLSI
jgi:hypothetical protein